MIVRLFCGALQGINAYRVDLETEYNRSGMPAFVMVGLAEGAVREAKERVFTAIRSTGLKLAPARITVNLAPADRKKMGSAYDLALAMSLLCAAQIIHPQNPLEEYFFAGELSLSGGLRPVPGILPLAILARSLGVRAMIVAEENVAEASIVEGLTVYGISHLNDVIAFVCGQKILEPRIFVDNKEEYEYFLDFSEVKGQEQAKRAIEIAAAGGHNLLLIGPPGSGKSMLAKRIPTVLPPLNFEEALEVTTIYSVSGQSSVQGLIRSRPFRTPHHTVSDIALIGGGIYPRPGEVSLAHRGVLFLDELPEFHRSALEVLRQPLEDGVVTIARSAQTISYPASCMLVAAMNPCPCGYYGDNSRRCTCSEYALSRYQGKLSGPLLDRIDLHIEVPAVAYDDFQSQERGLDSKTIRENVLNARGIQKERYQKLPFICNAELSGASLSSFCLLGEAENEFLKVAVESLGLSARAYTRILRIARTIADLDTSELIQIPHLAEAIQCRVLDRGLQ